MCGVLSFYYEVSVNKLVELVGKFNLVDDPFMFDLGMMFSPKCDQSSFIKLLISCWCKYFASFQTVKTQFCFKTL